MSAETLTPADIATLLGLAPERGRLIDGLDIPPLAYAALPAEEAAAQRAAVEAVLDAGAMRVVGNQESEQVWQRGWGEIAEALDDVTLESLRPQYFKPQAVCRLRGRYVRGLDDWFEFHANLALRELAFAAHCAGWPRVVELGCGTGLNALLLARRFPQVDVIASDWAAPSGDLIAAIDLSVGGGRVRFRRFDMLDASGWDCAEIDPGTCVLTVHALEQLGDRWTETLDLLLERRPGRVVHIEPIVELYADDDWDAPARRYHTARNYLHGWLPRLQALDAEGRIALERVDRVPFGGLYHDAFNVLVWRPR